MRRQQPVRWSGSVVGFLRDICTLPVPQRACTKDICGYCSGRYNIHSDTGSLSLPAGSCYFLVDGYQESTGTWKHCGNCNVTVTGIP